MSDERLARIEALLEHLADRLEDGTETANTRWEHFHKAMYGDNNGLMVRVDRLEQDLSSRKKREAVLFTAVVGLIAKALHGILGV